VNYTHYTDVWSNHFITYRRILKWIFGSCCYEFHHSPLNKKKCMYMMLEMNKNMASFWELRCIYCFEESFGLCLVYKSHFPFKGELWIHKERLLHTLRDNYTYTVAYKVTNILKCYLYKGLNAVLTPKIL
jgi:hypothetical protein